MARGSHRQLRSVVVAIALLALLIATAVTSASTASPTVHAASGTPVTFLISRGLGGAAPNGPSTHPVISNDKRYARAIAFQSEASNLVRGDTNGVSDVFVVKRTGKIDNEGVPWQIGKTSLISRTGGGAGAHRPPPPPREGGGIHQAPPPGVALPS